MPAPLRRSSSSWPPEATANYRAQQWLQLLTSLGIDDVQIRGARGDDEPKLENRGTEDRPRYHVVGILSAGEELHLPGGTSAPPIAAS